MKRSIPAAALSLLVALGAAPPQSPQSSQPGGAPPAWSLEVDLVESCCCLPICPCIVGSPPTHGHCVGNRLVEITRGHYGDVSLDGVALVIVFEVGQWSKLYFEKETTDRQVEAARRLLALRWPSLFREVLVVDRVPLAVERDQRAVAFSVPAARTRIEVMTGADDKPIRIVNLSSFKGYVQYRSVELVHESGDEDEEDEQRAFSLSGTNGFTARYLATSRPLEKTR